jgi:hypothetical protein
MRNMSKAFALCFLVPLHSVSLLHLIGKKLLRQKPEVLELMLRKLLGIAPFPE